MPEAAEASNASPGYANVKEAASVLESELLKLGVSPQFSGFNGASEFRALTDAELELAIDLIKRYQ